VGTFGKKFKNCEQCDFYQKAKNEEKESFNLAITLLGKLKDSLPGKICRNLPALFERGL
jgi:hypothetical protein